ncbi:hypothetical protein L286_16480 [Sphingobium sp. HDIP04]|nr:hypothetical protein L286_16480 [Sphingobium sp. HDIP04]
MEQIMNRAFLYMIFAAAIIPAAQSHAAEGTRDIPAFFSGNQLFEICSNPNYGQCSMYVAGVIDGIFLADGEGGRQSLCRSEITNRGAAELVLNRLSGDTALRSLSAAAAVRAAVANRLSCAPPPLIAQQS